MQGLGGRVRGYERESAETSTPHGVTVAPRAAPADAILALQASAGNHAVSRLLTARAGPSPTIRRKLKLTGTTLQEDGRFPFDSNLQAAMKLDPNTARCHTIAYEVIRRGVAAPINGYLADRKTNAHYLDVYLDGLLASIYPNGATIGSPALKKLDQFTLAGLQQIATANYAAAANSIGAIKGEASKQNPNMGQILAQANTLISCLNNSPDNLRPGWSGTNSSIQGGLDLIQTGTATLPAGTSIVDRATMDHWDYKTDPLPAPVDVAFVDPLHEHQVWTLLTSTYGGAAREVHLYSSGKALQSSNVKGMKTSSMTDKNPVRLAVAVPNKKDFFLFDVV